MSLALACSALTKSFTAGAGRCLVRVAVLRGVDLEVRVGEAVAIVGDASSGKSTLLLCAAGLLRPDGGRVGWFGEPSRTMAAARVSYHWPGAGAAAWRPLASRGASLRGGASRALPHLHLLDDPLRDASSAQASELARWMAARCRAGDAVVVTSRSAATALVLDARIVALAAGRLRVVRVGCTASDEARDGMVHARVAERPPVC